MEEEFLLKIIQFENASKIEVNVTSGRDLFELACCLLQLIKENENLAKAMSYVSEMLESDPEARRLFDNACINVPDFNTLLKN